MSPLLKVADVSKSFGALKANSNISFEVSPGEVLAILGENGAGKTTLMNIIFGHYLADTGDVEFKGSALRAGDPRAAIEAGIGMVHQHFTLAENLTVLENTLIGAQSLWKPRLNSAAARRKLIALADRFGLEMDPDRTVSELSVGEKQRLEILKTLYNDCELLILDEPTASLTPQEASVLFASIRSMVSEGLAVIVISHKLHEILKISDRIIVLRSGKTVGDVLTSQADKRQLGEMIVGQQIERPKRGTGAVESVSRILLENVNTKGGTTSVALDEVSLSLFGGEIIGIAGVAGNGQKALAEVMSGHQQPSSGRIIIDQQPFGRVSPRTFMQAGIAYIPEDRNLEGMVGDMTVWENAVLSETANAEMVGGFSQINKRACLALAERICADNDVRTQSLVQPTRLLSGGNVQKLLIGRWLARNPRIIIACQPSRGLDEGAISAVHRMLLAARQSGSAILLISEDLEEIMALADRIAVMFDGRLSEPMPNSNVDPVELGLMMTGEGLHAV